VGERETRTAAGKESVGKREGGAAIRERRITSPARGHPHSTGG